MRVGWVRPQRIPCYKAKLFWLVFFRVKTVFRNRVFHFPETEMFSGGNFPVKIEIQNSVSEFARRYMMPDVGAGACVLPSPPALGRQAARPGPPRYGRGPAGPAGPAAPPAPPAARRSRV